MPLFSDRGRQRQRQRRRRRPRQATTVSFLLFSFLLLLCFLIHPVNAAWQEISAYTDCGSTNFKTEKILVNFNDETYWLNMSIQGQFAQTVEESSLKTEKPVSTLLLRLL